MTTTRDERQGGNDHPRWQAFKRSFAQSNYVTDCWNWLLTLLSKAADCVLFASILYSSYQIFPGVPHASAGFDAGMFLAQQAALDIGGLGLLKLAKRANLAPSSFPMRVGITLVTLMIFNVVLASLKHALAFLPDAFFLTVETMLLVARAVMAVLFGYAIHALREEYGDSMITIQEARQLQTRLEAVADALAELSRTTLPAEIAERHEHVAQVEARFHLRLTENASALQMSFHETVQRALAGVDAHVHNLLRESSATLDQRVQTMLIENAATGMESLQRQLSQIRVETQREQELLSLVPILATQIERMEKQVQQHLHEPEKPGKAVVIQAFQEAYEKRQRVPHGAVKMVGDDANERFDTRAFVFSCLQENAHLKLAEIAALARGEGQELSLPTISRYRKQFFDTRESSAVVGEELVEHA
jgi:hypothetical protein